MRSNLSAASFKKELKNNTKKGSFFYKLSPFAIFTLFEEYEKIFLGNFSNDQFYLTRNNFFKPGLYSISGKYTEMNENTCEVEYTIKPILWLLIMYVFSLIIGGYLQ